MKRSNNDIWVTYHWWGWKLHFNQNGLDMLNHNLKQLGYHWNSFSFGYGFGYIADIIYLLILIISSKIISLKYKACENNNKRWCNSMFDCQQQCPEIMIKELTINFLWLPIPLIPIATKITK